MSDEGLPCEASAEQLTTLHNGRRIRWYRWGQGPAVLLLHGGHGSWMHWVHNVVALSAHHTVWVPDMPGFGASDSLPCAPHDPNRLNDLVAALVVGLDQVLVGDQRLDVVGFSFGGVVATQVARLWPGTRRLALLGPAGHGGARRQTTELLNWRGLGGAALWQTQAHNLAAFMLHDPAKVDATALLAHHCSARTTRFRSKSISRQNPLLDQLSTHTQDLLLVWGEHDVTVVPDSMGPQLVAQHHNRHLVVVPGTGHWVQFEQPAVTNSVLLSWLSGANALSTPRRGPAV